ncbi:sigma-70 family RNA polymerase sigma factor [Paenibacillus rhizovicinus]|uniref:RNA polymerase sigma factor n=2 Tax=Paenibacillus rhizovicinus TaxID=2704463 RepID=A0A6C0PCR0_9BACL|nr:sigma-70 family RNA polymerase sigma factor [Paenibacillus rhizovicinus]
MDTSILEELMQRYGQDVWSFAYSLTRSRMMADDVAQDVFLQAYLHVASFRGESSAKTWLLKITRNISLNYRKSAFVRKVLLIDAVIPKQQEHSAEQSFLEREASNEVWRQVLRLSNKYREVLVLHAKYQLSLPEIADVLKIPQGTVKSRLFGARKKLSLMLTEDMPYELN